MVPKLRLESPGEAFWGGLGMLLTILTFIHKIDMNRI